MERIFAFLERVGLRLDKFWRTIPSKYQEKFIPILNYFINAIFISLVIVYGFLFDIAWVRYVFLVPVLTIFLMYFEHYYHWLRLGYKDK